MAQSIIVQWLRQIGGESGCRIQVIFVDQRSPAVDDRVPTSHLILQIFVQARVARVFWIIKSMTRIFQIVFVYWEQAVLDSLPAVSTCFERIKEVAIKQVMFKVEFFVTGNLVGKDLFGPNHSTTVQQIHSAFKFQSAYLCSRYVIGACERASAWRHSASLLFQVAGTVSISL